MNTPKKSYSGLLVGVSIIGLFCIFAYRLYDAYVSDEAMIKARENSVKKRAISDFQDSIIYQKTIDSLNQTLK